ncbi:MAG TPA: tRNA guanosine(34) transglycosylase Tgt, partial [Phycisphaerales bacterium]|nr:tRNA guanosine(34) transglycosylase Tgt [Phycisphaerales bacterium]
SPAPSAAVSETPAGRSPMGPPGARDVPVRLEVVAHSRLTRARRGRVHTPHGSFETPAFMPVGTRGTVKGVLPSLVASSGAEVILGNTYHLMLRPGADTVAALGGLHRFTNWHGPILTDSGGYQAYSMGDTTSLGDDGVLFRSIVDGSRILLTPERAIAVQNQLGADIIMALDDCPPSVDPAAAPPNRTRDRLLGQRSARPATQDHAARLRVAGERTIRWLERCRAAHLAGPRAGDQALFGIIQGGIDPEARARSAAQVCALDLPGYAIGGVAVGEAPDEIARVVRHTAPLIPAGVPRYLMGVGYERDLLAACQAGVDMFDCVLPTRNARNACAFTPSGRLRLRNAAFATDPAPIQPGCDCPACAPASPPAGRPGGVAPTETWFSRAYIRHLFMAEEMLGPILVTLHNLRHFQRLMTDLRATIVTDDWTGLIRRWPVAAPGATPESVAAAAPPAPGPDPRPAA